MRILFGVLAGALLLVFVSSVLAAPGGSATMTFWNNLPPDDQSAFLAGAIEMLGGFGLQCPGKLTLKDIKDTMGVRLRSGKSSPDDRFAWEVLSTVSSIGCNLDRATLDSLDPTLRKKLR